MTRTHEIKLDGYGAHTTLAEDRPIMLLGTAESYGIEMLHVVHGESWEGLTITATFNAPDGTSTDMLMSADGSITVPSEATAKSGSGKIVFTGVSNGVQRISCDLEYFVVAHSSINGAQSGGTAPSWFEQAATRFMPPGGTIGQVLTKLTGTDFDAKWQDSQGGAGLAPLIGTTQTVTPSQVLAAIKAGRDIALQYTDSYYGTIVFGSFIADEKTGAVVSGLIIPQLDGVTGALLGLVDGEEWSFRATNVATKNDVGVAVNEALAQAKASGEFDGADGQDGVTPTIGENGNWYLGDTDTGKPSRGDKGEKGDKGDKGDTGETGATGATGAAGAAGKSAYAYAQDGGYTGTEAEFAAKMAAEMPTTLPNPNALTFTGAVTGSYDGSAALSVEIPSGSGASEGSSQWKIIRDLTISENADRVDINQDNDGNTFALHEIHVFSYTQSYADSSGAYTFLLNGFWNVGDPYFNSGFKSTASSSDYYAENHFIATMQNGFANIFQPWKASISGTKPGGDVYSFGDKYQTIESVSFVGKFIAGCRFILVGRVTL